VVLMRAQPVTEAVVSTLLYGERLDVGSNSAQPQGVEVRPGAGSSGKLASGPSA
jgi:hypothetical protein